MSSPSFNQKYTLEQELGRGGFSVTWLAHRRTDDRRGNLVIKELLLDKVADWKAVEQFEREARVMSHLKHTGIPELYDFLSEETETGKRVFLVQKYIQGQDLDKLIQGGKYFTEKEVIAIGIAVSEILQYLHSFSPPLLHRDIKPSNIMLRDADRKVYLIDFGAVKGPANEFSSGHTVTGTFGYMPLEQLESREAPASDIYALGMSLIYILSHQEPTRLPKKGLKVDFRPHVNISEPLARVLDKMIEPDLEKRYQSAKEVLAEFEKLRAGGGSIAAVSSSTGKPLPWRPILGSLLVFAALGFCALKEMASPPIASTEQSAEASLNAAEQKQIADGHYRAENCAAAVPAYSLYLAEVPKDIEALFRRGYCYSELSEHNKALSDYQQVLVINPDRYNNVHYNLGYNYYQLGKYPQALFHLKAMLAIDPKEVGTLNYLGLVHREEKRLAEAEAVFKQILTIQPDYKYAHNNLGTIYQRQKKYPEALQAFGKASEVDPSYALPHYNRGEVYYTLEKYPECLQEQTLAIGKNTSYASAYNMRGLCHRALKQHEQAAQDFASAIQHSPSYATAVYNLALTHDDLGRLDQAIEGYKKAIVMTPGYAKALNNLGYIYQRQENYPQALNYYSQAVAAEPKSGLYYRNRGNIYKLQGQCEQARQDWQKACQNGNASACKLTC